MTKNPINNCHVKKLKTCNISTIFDQKNEKISNGYTSCGSY